MLTPSIPQTGRTTSSEWPLISGLVCVTVIAQLISLGFGRINEDLVFLDIALTSGLVIAIITLPCCYLGIRLGRELNFDLRELDVLSFKPDSSLDLQKNLVLASLLGVAIGTLLLLVRAFTAPYLPAEIPDLGFRGWSGGLAVSIGAAVAEEVWFRLGLFTVLVWTWLKITRTSNVSRRVAWSIILISAIGFAAAHVPQLVAYGAGSLIGISGTMLGNIAVGTLYGWLYWKQGLLSAITAHFSADIMLHVVSVAIW